MTGGTTLTVTGNCTTSVTRLGSGHVNGILKLTYPAGTPTCTYHVGDATNYTPITVALTGATAGTITGSVTASAPPNLSISPLSSSKYVNRYWTLGGSGDTATATSYGATLNWVAGDIQGGANYQNFIVGENQGGWVVPGPGVGANAATSIVATNVTTAFTSAASFGVGEAYACLPPPNIPAGVTVGCVCDNFGRANLNPSSIFNSNWLLSTSSGSFGIPRIVNQGRLQLTNATNDNASAATVPGIFPAAGNYISVEFQQYAYNNASGADGIAVTLSDYSVAPTPGAYGGSLGYAQKTGINGFAGGWIGVALDEYGNFENNTEGRSGGTPPCAGQCRDSVGVRGIGFGQRRDRNQLSLARRQHHHRQYRFRKHPRAWTQVPDHRRRTQLHGRHEDSFRFRQSRRDDTDGRELHAGRRAVRRVRGEPFAGGGAGQLADLVHRVHRRIDQHPRDRQPQGLCPGPDPAHRQLDRSRLQRHRQRFAQHQAERAVRAHLHESRRRELQAQRRRARSARGRRVAGREHGVRVERQQNRHRQALR